MTTPLLANKRELGQTELPEWLLQITPKTLKKRRNIWRYIYVKKHKKRNEKQLLYNYVGVRIYQGIRMIKRSERYPKPYEREWQKKFKDASLGRPSASLAPL